MHNIQVTLEENVAFYLFETSFSLQNNTFSIAGEHFCPISTDAASQKRDGIPIEMIYYTSSHTKMTVIIFSIRKPRRKSQLKPTGVPWKVKTGPVGFTS